MNNISVYGVYGFGFKPLWSDLSSIYATASGVSITAWSNPALSFDRAFDERNMTIGHRMVSP